MESSRGGWSKAEGGAAAGIRDEYCASDGYFGGVWFWAWLRWRFGGGKERVKKEKADEEERREVREMWSKYALVMSLWVRQRMKRW